MNRRTFIQSIGAAIAGIPGLKLLKPKPKAELTEAMLSGYIEDGKRLKNGSTLAFTASGSNATTTFRLYGVDNQGNCHLLHEKTEPDTDPQSVSFGECNLIYDGRIGGWRENDKKFAQNS